MKKYLLSTLCIVSIGLNANAQELPPVPENEVGIVETLPATYPDSWIFASVSGFPLGGIVAIVDVAATNNQYKGSIGTGYEADFISNEEKNEFYVSETYYSRGIRGVRHDMISVYDQSTLKLKSEMPLEVGKRFLVSAMAGKFSLINNKKWALVANYTPAASVTIVDMENQKILNEVPIPGCNLAYPMGERGFATMCGYGEVISINLDENGKMVSEHASEPFNDLDNDPHFEKAVRVGDQLYFPTYKGNITSIDLSGDQAIVGETWSLLSDDEREQGWRPGGWQIMSKDVAGNLYIIMHENGFNGSHKEEGSEVWVFNPNKKERIGRYKLKKPAYSIMVTKEENPHIAVFSQEDSMIRVYDGSNGDYIRPIYIGKMVGTMYVPE